MYRDVIFASTASTDPEKSDTHFVMIAYPISAKNAKGTGNKV